MEHKKEWLVLRFGVLWSDRFDSEDLAKAHVEECVKDGYGVEDDYEVREMYLSEIKEYYKYTGKE